MERSSDHDKLAAALAEVRPAPRDEFAHELDERVAAGFPRRSRFGGLATFGDRLRNQAPRRLALAGGTIAVAAIAVSIAVVTGGGPSSERIALDRPAAAPGNGVQGGAGYSDAAPRAGTAATESASSASSSGERLEATGLSPRNRKIERSARIFLLADPADVAADSADVFAAVHEVDGIVLHSTTSAGEDAGARFDLLIPSAKLGDALAAFSAIDEVGARHEATADITAATVSARERLQDSQARIDALLNRLAAAEGEAEMAAIETELRRERRHAARLRAQLDQLQRRADYSRVSVQIESGEAALGSGGAWGAGDALDDAGRILAVAAGVVLLGLALVAPVALLALLAWLAHRTWLRRARKRALA